MRKIAALLGLGLLVFGSVNCERDDICGEDIPTTPRIFLEYYNNDTTVDLKAVTMDMREIGSEDTIRVSAQTSVYVPLRTDADSVTWIFTVNPDSSDPNLVRTDTITFNYTRTEVFVSRACGYKTVYDLNNQAGQTPAIQHSPSPPNAWMRDLIIDSYDIETEDDAHIRVFW